MKDNTFTEIDSELVFDSNPTDILHMALETFFVTFIADKHGIIRQFSQSYADYFDMKAEDCIGKKIEEVIPNTEIYRLLESGEPELGRIFELRKDCVFVCNRLPIKDSAGRIQGVACMASTDTSSTIESLYNEVKELRLANEIYRKQLKGLNGVPEFIDAIAGDSPKIMTLKKTLSRVINSSMPILLTGESGVGKEVFANAIHKSGNRKNSPYIKVNCAAIPKDLMESELFGYEAGTFSGANKGGKAGKLELANNGIILFDEIEELPLAMQSKLLRVLQEYEVERIGSVNPIPLNLQVICCSNKDLYAMVDEGTFREDLLYRINVMEIDIPPLRERMEDLPILCENLIKRINNKYKLSIDMVTDACIEFLSHYRWPGNIRELEHALERACALTDNNYLDIEDFEFLLPKMQKFEKQDITDSSMDTSKRFFATKDLAEKELILSALEKTCGNKMQAAKDLGISRSLLYAKLRKFDIK